MVTKSIYARMDNNELAQAIGSREHLIMTLTGKEDLSGEDKSRMSKAKKELAMISREVDKRNSISSPYSSGQEVDPEGFKI